MNVFSRRSWKLDHVGHAVENLDAATSLYREKFGFALDSKETLKEHQVEVGFFRAGDTLIELLAPLAGNKILKNFLAARGPGLHHICFRVDSVSAELRTLAVEGFRLIDTEPRLGSRNMHVAFLHPSSCEGVLVELCGNA